MYKVISTDQFKEIMDDLYQKDVWIQFALSITNLNLFFPTFEFCVLTNDKYQFGTDNIDSDRIPFSISIDDIETIQRDEFAPIDNGEWY